MEREVRHPYLFTLCGFVLCFMFIGNLARADRPYPAKGIPVYLNMHNAQESRLQANMLAYSSPVALSSEVNIRVFAGTIGVQTVLYREWIAVSLTLGDIIHLCKDYQNQHRIEVGKGELTGGVVIEPRLTVEGNSTVCRLDMAPAAED